MSERITDVADRIYAAVQKTESDLTKRIDQISAGTDEALRQIARVGVGGMGGSGGIPESIERRLEVFNAALAERGATPISYADLGKYDSAISAYFRFGQKALDRQEIRAELYVGSDPAGGYLVVDDKDPVPREKLFRTSPMRALASVQQVSGGAFEGVLEDGDFGAGWVAEIDARPETDNGSLAEFRIVCQEQYANVPITQRLVRYNFSRGTGSLSSTTK